MVKRNKTFRWVGIPCSWDCFRCWPRCWWSKVKTAAKGQQDLLSHTIDPTVIRPYFIGSYIETPIAGPHQECPRLLCQDFSRNSP